MEMTGLNIFFILSCFVLASYSHALPMLNIDGFSWAENLAFDGIGGLFVSEAVRGQLWRISYDSAANNYTANIHVSRGFKQFGGLAPTVDGETIYAAAVNQDKDFVIISTSTAPARIGEKDYKLVTSGMDHLANGMALIPEQNALYCTSESGTLTKVDISTGEKIIVTDQLLKPDGLWYDRDSGLLFVCELVTKKMKVYNWKTNSFSDYFAFGSSVGTYHLIDDITVVGKVDPLSLEKTVILGADWTGRTIVELTLSGDLIQKVPAPEGINYFEPTSIRRGKGPGFDENSFYITEGGGLTRNAHNRRVLQLTPGAI